MMGSGIAPGRLRLLTLFVMMLWAGGAGAAAAARAVQDSKADDAKVHVLHVQGNVYMLVEPNQNNITVQIGNQYIIVVDTGVPECSDEAIAALRLLSDLD